MTRRSNDGHGTDSTGLSRRGFLHATLAGVGAAAVGGLLSGCGPAWAGTPGRRDVRIWDLFQGADGARMQNMQAAVMRQNPDLAVDSVTLAWGSPYYTKLAMAASGGRPPEAAALHLSRLYGYAPGGLLEPFDTDRLAELGVHQKDFPAAVWDRALYQGQLYALPLDTHPFLAFYNPTIARDAGLLTADGKFIEMTSPEEFLAAGRAMAEVTGAQGMAFGYVLDTAQPWRFFWGLYHQTGATYELTPGSEAVFDEDKATEVIEFMQQMLDGTVAVQKMDYSGAIASFNTGKSGLIVSGEWELPSFQEALGDVGAMPMPNLFGTPANYADSHAFVLPRQAHPDPARRDATYRALAALLGQSLTWAKAGHIPAYTPILETREYAALHPQKDYAAAGEIAVLDPPVWFAGAGGDFQARMSDAMSSALQGNGTAAEAARRMRQEMNRFLAKPNPTA